MRRLGSLLAAALLCALAAAPAGAAPAPAAAERAASAATTGPAAQASARTAAQRTRAQRRKAIERRRAARERRQAIRERRRARRRAERARERRAAREARKAAQEAEAEAQAELEEPAPVTPVEPVTWHAPCIDGTAGPLCHFWEGNVRHVSDGDTLVVDLGDRIERVRIAGIQAMEQTVYGRDALLRQGDCHALEATRRLEELTFLARGRARVSAQEPASRSGRRWRRSVQLWLGDQWVDVGSALVAEGHALFLPNGTEWAWNARYGTLAQQAASQGLGLWNTEYCAGGPPAALKVWVNSNAPGNDAVRPDGEWIRVKNRDYAQPVDISGWWLRDSGTNRFVFPAGSVLGPGASVAVHVGTAPAGAFSFGLGKAIFENAEDDGRGRGDGAYLFDPHGDLRAWQQYPCRFGCADPYGGTLELRALPRADAVTITNHGAGIADLDGLRLSVRRRAQEVGPGIVLAPGETTRIEVPWLRNAGDVVRLDTYDKVLIACAAWGTQSC